MLNLELRAGRSAIYEAIEGPINPANLPDKNTWIDDPLSSPDIPPFNFLPGLLSPESWSVLQAAQRQINTSYKSVLGHPFLLTLYKSYLKLDGIEPRWVPWDIYTSFRFRDIHIAGPIVVSFDHSTLTRETDSDTDRQESEAVVNYHLGNLTNNWPLTIISMPKRPKGSLTHKILIKTLMPEQDHLKTLEVYLPDTLFREENLIPYRFSVMCVTQS